MTQDASTANADQEADNQPEKEVSPYEMIGGAGIVRRVVDRFYDIMDTDPRAAGIRAMHAKDLGPMRDRLFEFLSGWLGGPQLYFQNPNHKCVVSAHRPFAIDEAARDEWMMCIRQAMTDCDVPEDVRKLLDMPFMRVAEAFRNRGQGREPKPTAAQQ